MSRAYSTCILLIEFDPDKPFYLLQSRSASALKRVDLSPTDLISKLVLLLIHHPKLKILWTSGPRLTCDIFHDLKRNEPNPNSEESGQAEGQALDEKYNSTLKVKSVHANGRLCILCVGNSVEASWTEQSKLFPCHESLHELEGSFHGLFEGTDRCAWNRKWYKIAFIFNERFSLIN